MIFWVICRTDIKGNDLADMVDKTRLGTALVVVNRKIHEIVPRPLKWLGEEDFNFVLRMKRKKY
uniref:Uncharacterized protein n=1 Tax=Megaselia scalaris TaxID=36166 RepID=T1GCY8_MEGSC